MNGWGPFLFGTLGPELHAPRPRQPRSHKRSAPRSLAQMPSRRGFLAALSRGATRRPATPSWHCSPLSSPRRNSGRGPSLGGAGPPSPHPYPAPCCTFTTFTELGPSSAPGPAPRRRGDTSCVFRPLRVHRASRGGCWEGQPHAPSAHAPLSLSALVGTGTGRGAGLKIKYLRKVWFSWEIYVFNIIIGLLWR